MPPRPSMPRPTHLMVLSPEPLVGRERARWRRTARSTALATRRSTSSEAGVCTTDGRTPLASTGEPSTPEVATGTVANSTVTRVQTEALRTVIIRARPSVLTRHQRYAGASKARPQDGGRSLTGTEVRDPREQAISLIDRQRSTRDRVADDDARIASKPRTRAVRVHMTAMSVHRLSSTHLWAGVCESRAPTRVDLLPQRERVRPVDDGIVATLATHRAHLLVSSGRRPRQDRLQCPSDPTLTSTRRQRGDSEQVAVDLAVVTNSGWRCGAERPARRRAMRAVLKTPRASGSPSTGQPLPLPSRLGFEASTECSAGGRSAREDPAPPASVGSLRGSTARRVHPNDRSRVDGTSAGRI